MIEGQGAFSDLRADSSRSPKQSGSSEGSGAARPGGELVWLDQVGAIRTIRGPEVISRENAQRRIAVQTNVRGMDLGSFVRAAQEK
jgi:cobalt-zinc-cadmium resistance protein CzcA